MEDSAATVCAQVPVRQAGRAGGGAAAHVAWRLRRGRRREMDDAGLQGAAEGARAPGLGLRGGTAWEVLRRQPPPDLRADLARRVYFTLGNAVMLRSRRAGAEQAARRDHFFCFLIVLYELTSSPAVRRYTVISHSIIRPRPGVLVTKAGYFGVKSAKVPQGQIGT